MNKIEELELELAARKMVEGTALLWRDVIKGDCSQHPWMCFPRERYELALGIVEGKPVWKGDTLYSLTNGDKFIATDVYVYVPGQWSWNPPKPKTIMIELTIEDIEWLGKHWSLDIADTMTSRVGKSCRKALEEMR